MVRTCGQHSDGPVEAGQVLSGYFGGRVYSTAMDPTWDVYLLLGPNEPSGSHRAHKKPHATEDMAAV